MPCTSSLLRTLEAELQRRLSLTYTIEQLFDGSGSGTFLKVSLRNDSPARLTDIRGTIEPASTASFTKVWFRLPSLEPRGQVEISLIRAQLPANHLLVPVATAHLTSQVDLSFPFSATGLSVTCEGKPAALPEIDRTWGAESRRRFVKTAPTGIPLSPMEPVR